MAKRFTDTEKWRKNWFYNLSNEGKILWMYVCDKCDHIGICEFNERLYTADLGFKINKPIIEELLSKQLHWITNYRFFIKDFIDFQYGELNPNNRLHKSVLDGLKKHNLDLQTIKNQEYQAPLEGLASPIQGAKDKDKDKIKDKEKDKEQEKGDARGKGKFEIPTLEEVREYISEKKYSFTAEQFYDHYESVGWKRGKTPMKDWKATCRTWQNNQNERGSNNAGRADNRTEPTGRHGKYEHLVHKVQNEG